MGPLRAWLKRGLMSYTDSYLNTPVLRPDYLRQGLESVQSASAPVQVELVDLESSYLPVLHTSPLVSYASGVMEMASDLNTASTEFTCTEEALVSVSFSGLFYFYYYCL